MTANADGKSLRILVAADTYPPHVNGAAAFGSHLVAAMAERGHDVHVLAARPERGPVRVEVTDQGRIYRLRSRAAPTHEYFRICLSWEIRRDIRRIFDEVRPDVVHAQSHYMLGRAAIDEASRRGIRVVATNHFMPENLEPFLPFPQWFRDIIARNSWKDMGKVLGAADVVTTPTPLAAQAMREHAFLHEVIPLSNGVDAAHYELAPGESVPVAEHPVVLFVGRLAKEKNIDVLLTALARTDPALNVHAEIVGGGEMLATLRALAVRLGVEHRVRFLGVVDDEQLRQAYLRATIFCQPGTAELQSLASLEAMSAGKPVVLANAMALPHLVEDGINGYLFTPNDPADLAAKLNNILVQNPDRLQDMGIASHTKATDHSLKATMDAFENLYRNDPAPHRP